MEFETIFNEPKVKEKPKAYAPDKISLATRRKKAHAPVYVDRTFKSNNMNWILFLMILAFNAFVFSAIFFNCVTAISGQAKEVVSFFYGVGVSILITKILFHQDWEKATFVSPAPIALYINALFAGFALTMDTANLIQKNVAAYLLVAIPVIGLLVMVLILNKEESK